MNVSFGQNLPIRFQGEEYFNKVKAENHKKDDKKTSELMNHSHTSYEQSGYKLFKLVKEMIENSDAPKSKAGTYTKVLDLNKLLSLYFSEEDKAEVRKFLKDCPLFLPAGDTYRLTDNQELLEKYTQFMLSNA